MVREAKLVLRLVSLSDVAYPIFIFDSYRDALATRLYSTRMMEQFISHRKVIDELMEFDENTIKLYTVCSDFLLKSLVINMILFLAL